jgi:hypothetical protein
MFFSILPATTARVCRYEGEHIQTVYWQKSPVSLSR